LTKDDQLKLTQKTAWSLGDFSVIGWNTVFPGELLIESVGVSSGHVILDVACGTGNLAISAARRNCIAHGIDYVPTLIDRARSRAESEGLTAIFKEADCDFIPYLDESFDRVFSIFGSMFSPNPRMAFAELVRVCRAGGRIGLASWTPDGFWGKTFELIAQFSDRPKPETSPVSWGTKEWIAELMGSSGQFLSTNVRVAKFRFNDTAHWIDTFSTYFGPLISVLNNLSDEQRKRLIDGLCAVLEEFNCSEDDTLVVGAEYLELVILKN
jgi:ubiquinone/menaquinone biosynthesis C-methylase UbiE